MGQGPWAVMTQLLWEQGRAWGRQEQWELGAQWGMSARGDSGLHGPVWLGGPSGSSQDHIPPACELAQGWPDLGRAGWSHQ